MVPQFKRTRTAASPPPLELELIEDPLRIEIAVEAPTDPHEPRASAAPAEGPSASLPPPEDGTEDVEIIDVTESAEPADEPSNENAERAPSRGKKKGRRRRRSMKPRAGQTAEPGEAAPEEGEAPEEDTAPQAKPSLTLKIPAQSQAGATALPDEEAPDPDEPRYCFCNQVSYGDVRPSVYTSAMHG